MKKLIMSHAALLLLGCYDPSATIELDETPLTATPPRVAPQLVGTAAIRSPGTETDAAVPGVEVCALDVHGSLCTWSANDGSYALSGLTPGSITGVRYAKPGLVPLIVEYDILDHYIGADVFLFSAATVSEGARKLGASHDPSASGGMVISANWISYGSTSPLDGVRARALGQPKFTYAGVANDLDTTLESTSASGWAIAMGTEPGPVQLEFSHIDPSITCGRLSYTDGTLQSSFSVQAVPGELTLTTVDCLRLPAR